MAGRAEVEIWKDRCEVEMPEQQTPPACFETYTEQYSTMANQVQQMQTLLEQKMNYRFASESLLLDALDTTGLRIAQSNKRLALLGDVFLKEQLLIEWYSTGASIGAANDIVSTIGNNANLAATARSMDLDACVIANPGHRGPISTGTLATTVEAVLGAIYLDSGKDMAVVKSLMVAMALMPENLS